MSTAPTGDGFAAGVDLGTTYASAAYYRHGTTEAIELEPGRLVSPSIIVPQGDPAQWLVGQAALDSRLPVARRFKRRLGAAPLWVAGKEHHAEQLLGVQLAWILARMHALLEGYPEALVLTYPSNWGLARQLRLQEVARVAGFPTVSVLQEPIAAATFYAAHTRAVRPGDVVAVYDLGGGTTDVTVMRKEEERFAVLASRGNEDGSADFDDLIVELVRDRVGNPPDLAIDQLLLNAEEAKQRLSASSQVTIEVPLLSGRGVTVPLTADEVRRAVWLQAQSGVTELERALHLAGVTPSEVSTVLLAGAGSALPLVRELVTEVIGRPPLMSDSPKLSVAYGAAINAAASAGLLVGREAEPGPPARPPDWIGEAGTGWSPGGPPPELSGPIAVSAAGLSLGPTPIHLDVPPTESTLTARLRASLPAPMPPEPTPEPVRTTGVDPRDAAIAILVVLVVVLVIVVAAKL